MNEPYTKVTQSEVASVFKEWLRLYDLGEPMPTLGANAPYEKDAAYCFFILLSQVRRTAVS